MTDDQCRWEPISTVCPRNPPSAIGSFRIRHSAFGLQNPPPPPPPKPPPLNPPPPLKPEPPELRGAEAITEAVRTDILFRSLTKEFVWKVWKFPPYQVGGWR